MLIQRSSLKIYLSAMKAEDCVIIVILWYPSTVKNFKGLKIQVLRICQDDKKSEESRMAQNANPLYLYRMTKIKKSAFSHSPAARQIFCFFDGAVSERLHEN